MSRIVRPRPGDLEAAMTRHPLVPSGEYVGAGVEICDLCGMSSISQMHQGVSEPRPPLVRPTVEDVVRERDDAYAEVERLRGLLREALWAIGQLCEALPATCQHHGTAVERPGGRACCDTGRPTLLRRQAARLGERIEREAGQS